jgi:hypothetical protein
MSRILAVGCLFCALAAAQTLSVEKLKGFIESSVKLKTPDKQVAAYLKHIQLSDKLDDRTIEDLQSTGAGPQTVAALKVLADASKGLAAEASALPPTPKPAVVPITPLSAADQEKVLQEMREYALDYTSHLPNYICDQLVRRSVAPAGTESWHQVDTVQIKLTYFEQHEKYQVTMMNNKMVDNISLESLQGATSEGEFGSMMRAIFEPRSQTDFQWERWGTLRGKRVHVFSYRVAQPNSNWTITYEKSTHITPGYHGLIYADKEFPSIMRITLEADDIPASFPVQKANTLLDYDFVDISGHQFVLPLYSKMEMRAGSELSRNETQFKLYRKYEAESKIILDTPATPPK